MVAHLLRDRMKIKTNGVYETQKKDMSTLRGVLHLFAPTALRVQRLIIDFFIFSQANDQQEYKEVPVEQREQRWKA